MNVVRITRVDDERLDSFYRYREEQLFKRNLFIGESELIINRALDNDYAPTCFLIREGEEDKYTSLFSGLNKDTTLYEVSYEVFSKLKGYILTRGILCQFNRKEELTIDEVIKDKRRIVVLEDVVNPTNVGAIFRNALGFYCDGILLTKGSCDPLSRRSIRTSMGNVFQSKWAYVEKESYIDLLHNYGYKTVALALRDNCLDIDDERLKSEEKLAIILGSEGYGMSEKTINESDYVCKISMNPSVDSLNVASASGIALWNLCKRK